MIDLVSNFIFFFAVIDPIGTIPVFLAVTSAIDPGLRRGIALQAVAVSAIVLIFFVVAGELVLDALGIPLPAFQIAGGIVLFLFAMTMIFGESKPEQELKMGGAGRDAAVFPLAIPSIASPGAMLAAVLQTENASYTLFEQAQIVGVMLAVLLVVLVLLLMSSSIHRLIGTAGASVISRVMWMILASVAVASVLEGISLYFQL